MVSGNLYSCEISRLKKVDILVVRVVGTGNQDQSASVMSSPGDGDSI